MFSGDLGQPGRPVLPDPVKVARADALVIESTYGNRLHRTLADTFDEFATVLTTTLPRGNVIVPAFAVGRTQEVLHVLADPADRERLAGIAQKILARPLTTAINDSWTCCRKYVEASPTWRPAGSASNFK